MRDSIWNKKIPTFLGILLITIGVLTTSYLVRIGIIYLSGASPSDNPQNVQISNITDTSISVTYTTQTPVIGTVSIGITKDTLQTALDDRDQKSGIPKEYLLHSITVKNLRPSTPYVFSITSGSTTYLNNGNLFSVKTAPTLSASPSSQNPISGKIIGSNGQIPTEALIFVTASNGQTLSTLTQNNGIFIIPLNLFRTNDLTKVIQLSSNTKLNLYATDGMNTSQASVLFSDTNPIPTMTLGNSYDFTTSIQPVPSNTPNIGFPAFSTSSPLVATPAITTPTKNETFSDQQPQFSGKALPNQDVTIVIHSTNAISTTVTANANGTWTYRPSSPLAPGLHTISITTKNAAGILQTIEQSFTVYAAGVQVDQTATPSATPTTIITPTATPTSVPTLAPTGAITATIAPTKPSIITPKPTLPATGSNTVTVAATIGLVTTGIGIVLYVVSLGIL